MNITKTHESCKTASKKLPNSFEISTGNIVPHNWYHDLTRPCGKSDTTAIAILSELVFLHRYNGATEFQLNFGYFARKFNFGLSQVKDAVVRLEKLLLLKRDLRTVVIHGRAFVNEMFLILNIQNVLKLNPHHKTSGQNDSNNSSAHEVKKFPQAGRNEGTSSLEFSSGNIDKKENNKKTRSSESNFNSNDSFSSSTHATVGVTPHKQRFNLASFYPLVQSDIDNLRYLADREFSGNAINEILLSLSKKLPEHSFPHKKAFISYMAKALTYEMRDAAHISNESFKIKANITAEDLITKQQEAFLSRIEESRDTSLKMQLSRKLAGVLDPAIAYKFLSSASFFKQDESLKSEVFKISLQTTLQLNDLHQRLILTQVRSVYGNHINEVDFSIVKPTKDTKLESDNQPQLSTQSEPLQIEGVWGKIRQGLIDYYGSGGNNMDGAWFSKLKADVDPNSRKLTLKAPTLFIKDWVQSNYLQLIDRICELQNHQLTAVVTV